MKRTLLSVLAFFFPWIAFLILGKPIAALAALALQLTFVGWLPASLWAWADIKRVYPFPPVAAQPFINKTDNINQGVAENQVVSPTVSSPEEKNGPNPPAQHP